MKILIFCATVETLTGRFVMELSVMQTQTSDVSIMFSTYRANYISFFWGCFLGFGFHLCSPFNRRKIRLCWLCRLWQHIRNNEIRLRSHVYRWFRDFFAPLFNFSSYKKFFVKIRFIIAFYPYVLPASVMIGNSFPCESRSDTSWEKINK